MDESQPRPGPLPTPPATRQNTKTVRVGRISVMYDEDVLDYAEFAGSTEDVLRAIDDEIKNLRTRGIALKTARMAVIRQQIAMLSSAELLQL